MSAQRGGIVIIVIMIIIIIIIIMFSMIMFCMIMCCIIIIISSSSSRGVIIKGGGDCSPGLAIDNVSVINVVIAVGLCVDFGRGDDTVGNPHQAQISQFELFKLIL